MQTSERQVAILKEWKTSSNNIVISAVAGSGKTTTLMLLLKNTIGKSIFLAFNKSIQEEIDSRIKSMGIPDSKAITLHSLGLSAIKKVKPGYFRINTNKSWDLVKKLQERMKVGKKFVNFQAIAKASYDIVNMNDVSRMFLTDDYNEIETHLLTMDTFIDSNDRLREMWRMFLELREESYQQSVLEIDFTDMIYVPVKFNLDIPESPEYLFIDECQDLNLVQHKLIDLMISKSTLKKWIAVGDRNQAIYGFAGANSNSFEMFFEKPGNTIELPLDICYRCDSDIVEAANEVYPIMQAAKSEEGIVMDILDHSDIKDNSLVICRNTGPLIKLYFNLIAEGRAVYINGNEIMAHLINFLKPYLKMSVALARREMGYIYDTMKEDTDQEKYKKYIFEENRSNFNIIANAMFTGTDSIEYVIKKLEDIFKNKENAIQLCTIHKSKGLEADVVYILNEKLIPSKFAKSPEQLKQEQNLKYVARTRAKHELYYLNL